MSKTTFAGTVLLGMLLSVGIVQPLAANPVYSNDVLADNPLAYWRLNDTSGLTADDSSPNASDGTYGASAVLHQAGPIVADATSYSANLSASSLVAPFTPAVGFQNAFSVEWWMNPTNVVSYNWAIGYGWGTWVFHGADSPVLNAPYVGINVGDRFTPSDFSPNTITDGVWQHFVFTFDNSLATNKGKFYKNGVQIAGKNMSVGTAWNVFNVTANSAAGLIAEVAIYGGALSASQVQTHYSAGITVPEPSTVAMLLGLGGAGLLGFFWRRRG